MANPYTDPRYQMARMMRTQSQGTFNPSSLGPAPSGSSVALGRAARGLASRNPSLRAQIDAIASGTAKPEQKGIAGAVLGNPLTKAVLAPLEILALPGRATVAAAREVVDVFDQNPNTKASFGDWTKNVKDKSYGFGKAFNIDTGNKWLDRAIGFAGDIALDPLNAASFGAGTMGHYTGRLDLAKAVLTHTGDSRLANAVQRFGRAAIKDADILERVGANRHGIYFFGKRIKVGVNGAGWRLPGSGAIGQMGEMALAKLRVSAMGTKAGKWLQKMTLPAEGLAARQALLQGQVGDEAAGVVISYLTAAPIARTVAGEALQREETLLANFLKTEANQGLDGYKNEVYKYLEKPELLATASPEMQRAVQQWSEVFQWYEKQVNDAIQAADPTFEFTPVEHYFPHMQTDAAFEYRGDMANPHSRKLNEIWARDPLEGGGNFKSRSLRAGDDWFGHTLTAEEARNVEFLNEVARPHLNGKDFFETDITKVMPKYVNEFSKEMGLLARHKHLADTGFWKRAEAVSVTGEVIDKELVDALKGHVGSLTDEMSALHKQLAQSHVDMAAALQNHLDSLRAQLDTLVSTEGALGSKQAIADAERAIDDVLNGSMTLTADTLQTVANSIGSLKNKFAALFGAEVKGGKLVMKASDVAADDAPHMLDGLVGYLDNLEADVQSLYDEMFVLEQDLYGEGLKAAHKQAEAKVGLMTARLAEAQAKLKEVSQFGNQLESAVASILNGGSLDAGKLSNEVAHVLAVAGQKVGISDSMTRDLMNKALGYAGGKMQELVAAQTKLADGLFKELTANSTALVDVVTKLSVNDFYNSLPKMFAGEMNIQQIREIGLWALLHDEVLHGGNVPEIMRSLRENLIENLRQADELQAALSVAQKESNAAGKMTADRAWSSFWNDSYLRARTAMEKFNELESFINSPFVKDIISSGKLDDVITAEQIDYVIRKNIFLNDLFPDPAGAEDELLSMMNAYDVLARRKDKATTESVLMGGREVSDVAMAGGTTYVPPKTWREFIERVQTEADWKRGLLDEKVYVFGSGVGKQEFSGREVIARADRVRQLRGQLKGRNAEVASEYKKAYAEIAAKYTPETLDTTTREGAANVAFIERTARQRAANIVEERVKRQGRILTEEMQAELKTITGGKMKVDSRMVEGRAYASKQELANSIISYSLVSQTTMRFNAVAAMMAPFGLVPTEKMFVAITKSVGEKFLPTVSRQLHATNRAYSILKRLDEEVAAAIADSALSGKAPSAVFKDFMARLTNDEKAILNDAIGNQIGWTADPYELRRGLVSARKGKGSEIVSYNGKEMSAKKAAENEFFDVHVKPWFEAAYPGKTPTKKAMDAALKTHSPEWAKSAKRAMQTPWGEGADISAIKNWFEDIIGESAIPGRSSKRYGTMRMGGNKNGVGMVGVAVLDSSNDIGTKMRSLSDFHKKLTAMLAPDADVSLFVANPLARQKTPTYYASLLRDQIEKMAQHLERKTGIAVDIANTEDIVGDVMKQIDAARAGARGIAAGELPENIAKTIDAANAKVAAHEAWKQKTVEITDELKTVRERIKFLNDNKNVLNSEQKKELKTLQGRRDSLVSTGKKLKEPERPTVRDRRIAENGSTAVPKRTQAGPRELSPAGKAAQSTIDDYNRLMANPLYIAAQNNQQMQNVLEQLAGHDLWKYKNGFTLDGNVYASMPDGTRIVFSEDEWNSLFTGHSTTLEREVASENATASLKVERDSMRILQRRRNEAVARYNEIVATWDPAYRGVVKSRYEARLSEAKRIVDDIDVDISKQLDDISRIEKILAAISADTQNAALEKLRVLVHGSDNMAPIFDDAGLKKFLEYGTPYQRMLASEGKAAGMPGVSEVGRRGRLGNINALTATDNPDMLKNVLSEEAAAAARGPELSVNVRMFNEASVGVDARTVKRRVEALTRVWQKSEDFKMLNRAAEIQKNMFVAQYKRYLDDADALSSYVLQVKSQLDNMQRKAAVVAGEADAAAQMATETARTAEAGIQTALGIEGPIVGDLANASVEDLTNTAGRLEANIVRPGLAAEPVAGSNVAANAVVDVVNAEALQRGAMGEANAARSKVEAWLGEPAVPAPKSTGTANQQWLVPKQPRNVGAREPMVKEAVAAWKNRTARFNSAQEVVAALKDQQSVLRAQMVIQSGSVDQFWRELADARSVGLSLRNQIDEISSVINNMPPKDMMDVIKKMAGGKKLSDDKIQNALSSYRSWIEQAKPVLQQFADNPDDPVYKAWAASTIADGALIDLEIEHADKLLQLSNASIPQWQTIVVEPLAKEYEKAAREAGLLNGEQKLMGDPRMLGLRGNSEAVELLQNIARIREPGVVNDMARFMRGYTGFFRSYATLSPGFHVRNSISNVFSMFSGGADFSNLREGFRLWRLMDNHFASGGTLSSWVATLPAEQQEFAMKAAQIMLGLGNGKTDDALEAFAKSNAEGVLRNNPLIRGSRKTGHKIEGSARFMMAYDGLAKGFDQNVSFNRVKRYLIDYNEKTMIDQTMRDIVPFWTWMSRNLPLQVINRWTNPKAYLIYQRAYNNFHQNDGSTPGYMQNQMAINLGGGLHFNPDLPFTGVNEQIQGMADPSKLMGFVNPGLRVPVEMLADKSFYSGQSFKDEFVKLDGKFSLLQPVFAAAGQIEYNSKGEPMVRKKAMYAMMNTIPFLQRIDKLSPSDSVDSAQAQNSINSFLGLPFKNVSQGMMDSENYRKVAQLKALQDRQRNIG
jgi:hypothetical protein